MTSAEKFAIYENKFSVCQSYRPNSIQTWANQLDLETETITKIIENLQIITARDIRNILRELVAKHSSIFQHPNTYITSFGGRGKSGDLILYEFRHTFENFTDKIIDSWEIPTLESGSIIIFLDDLIGTGKQSCEYINDRLNMLLTSHHEAYLICLFATPTGMDSVIQNTNFNVICGQSLCEQDYQFCSDECHVFEGSEKEKILKINNYLRSRADFNNGLLIAFYYAIPNNTMPIIWKEGFLYTDDSGNEKKWYALLPRKY